MKQFLRDASGAVANASRHLPRSAPAFAPTFADLGKAQRAGEAELARNPTAKTVIVPAEMSGLVGTIAGLGELVGLAKEQQQGRSDVRRDAPSPPPATSPAICAMSTRSSAPTAAP